MDSVRIKWIHKKKNAYRDGIEFNLSLEEYVSLIEDANITAEDIGLRSKQYCLGRKNEITGIVDIGPYEIGNCRFITNHENCSECHTGRVLSNERVNTLKGNTHNKGKLLTDEQRDLLSKQRLGVPKSELHKMAMRKPQAVTTCPYCNKSGGVSSMTRYHFENCKLRSRDD